ncbi:hypothetical protein [Roseobacter sp.]|uniref:hypothetical protein n=1 Tax=Roseobacter sp. TaxID=1907202 RepID=UPI003858D7F8
MKGLLFFSAVLSSVSMVYVCAVVGTMAILSNWFPKIAVIIGFVGTSTALYATLALLLNCTGDPFRLLPKPDGATEVIPFFQCSYKFPDIDRLTAFVFAPFVTVLLAWRTLCKWRLAAAERTI